MYAAVLNAFTYWCVNPWQDLLFSTQQCLWVPHQLSCSIRDRITLCTWNTGHRTCKSNASLSITRIYLTHVIRNDLC